MAKIKANEGVRINTNSGTSTNYGGAVYHNTRTWGPNVSGVNLFQLTQTSATSMKESVAITMRWACLTYSTPENDVLMATARVDLNTNGVISLGGGWDWINWSGNGILWPYIGMGGNSIFIGANNGFSYTIYGGVQITVSTLVWDKISITPFGD